MVFSGFGWSVKFCRSCPAAPVRLQPRWCTPFLGFVSRLDRLGHHMFTSVRPPGCACFHDCHGFIAYNRFIKFFNWLATFGAQNRTEQRHVFSCASHRFTFVFGGITGWRWPRSPSIFCPRHLLRCRHFTTRVYGERLRRGLARFITGSPVQRRMLTEHLAAALLRFTLFWGGGFSHLCFAPSTGWRLHGCPPRG